MKSEAVPWDPMPLPKWLRQGRNTVLTSKSLIVNFVSYLNERLKERNALLEGFNCLPTRDILHIYTICFISALSSATYRCRHTRCWTRRWYSLEILPLVSSTKYLWLMYIYNISSSYFAFLTYSFNRGKLVWFINIHFVSLSNIYEIISYRMHQIIVQS